MDIIPSRFTHKLKMRSRRRLFFPADRDGVYRRVNKPIPDASYVSKYKIATNQYVNEWCPRAPICADKCRNGYLERGFFASWLRCPVSGMSKQSNIFRRQIIDAERVQQHLGDSCHQQFPPSRRRSIFSHINSYVGKSVIYTR